MEQAISTKFRRVLGFAVLAVFVASCQTGSVRSEAGPPTITGKWYGTLKPPLQMDEQGKALATLMSNSRLDLELGPAGKFKLGMMGTSIEGSYTTDGKKVTLTYESLMGMSLKDSEGPLSFMAAEFKDPEVGEIQEAGKKLLFPGRKGINNEAEMTFTREPPEPEPAGAKSVSAEEGALLGTYVFDKEFEMKIEGSKAEQSAKKFLQSMMQGFRLELKSDNTFEMTMMMVMKGKWSAKGGELKLIVIEPDMKSLGGPERGAIPIRVSGKPGQLLMLNDKTGKVDFAVKREAQAG